MTKKIICLVLGLLMLLSVLTSCSNTSDASDIAEEASRFTTTLNLWVMTESELIASVSDLAIAGLDPDKDEGDLTDEEEEQLAELSEDQKNALSQLLAIRQEVNKITKAQYKTQLNIKYVFEEQYYEKVEAAFKEHEEAIEAAKAAAKAERESLKNGETTESEEEAEEETFINEYGIPELKYPEAEDYQVDVFFIGDYEKYREYADNEWLKNLDEYLENSAMEIASYVNQIFLQSTKYAGVTYAIPNNTTIGEYTYLCMKTEELGRFGYIVNDFANPSIYDPSVYEFLEKVYDRCYHTDTAVEDRVYPIYSANGKVDLSLVHYWNYDLDSVAGACLLEENTFSIFGGTFMDYYTDTNGVKSLTGRGRRLTYTNLLADSVYMEQYLARKVKYENEGFVTSDPAYKDSAAVQIVEGGWELKSQYENAGYTVFTMETPRANNEIYKSMFAVGEHTSDGGRAMEIITLLNTDKDFRNLIQYGVENVNYVLKETTEEDAVGEGYQYIEETENNLYKMDVNKTGNVFLAYPNSKDSVLEWEYGKQQNLDAGTYPTLGLYFDSAYILDANSVRIIDEVSKYLDLYIQQRLTTSEAVMNFYYNRTAEKDSVSELSNDDNGMATFLLSKAVEMAGTDLTYKNANGETVTITAANLAAAITCMKTKTLAGEKDPQSPYALYENWLTTSGVNG